MRLNLTAAEYHARPETSASLLKQVHKGAPRVRQYLGGRVTFGPSVALGTAGHALTLDPASFDAECAVAPDVNRRTKAGREEWEAFQASAGGRAVITSAQYEAAQRIAEAVHLHPLASQLLDGADREVSFVWDGRKARIDAINVERRCVIDLKTTADASPAEYVRKAWRYGVPLQLAWYADACAAHGIEIDEAWIIAVDNADPYGVACYRLDEHALSIGRRQYLDALDALETLAAPSAGYSAEPIEMEIPAWIR